MFGLEVVSVSQRRAFLDLLFHAQGGLDATLAERSSEVFFLEGEVGDEVMGHVQEEEEFFDRGVDHGFEALKVSVVTAR